MSTGHPTMGEPNRKTVGSKTVESNSVAREKLVKEFTEKAELSRGLEREATVEIDLVLNLTKGIREMIVQDDHYKSFTEEEQINYPNEISPKNDVLSLVDDIITASLAVKKMLPDYHIHPLDKKSQMDKAIILLSNKVDELQLLSGRTGVKGTPELNKKIIQVRNVTEKLFIFIYNIENAFSVEEAA